MYNLVAIIKEIGWKNTLVGSMKMIKRKRIQKKYNLGKWFTGSYETRKYAQEVVEYVNASWPNTVVDLGCGMGDMISHIHAAQKYGYDPKDCLLQEARKIDKSGTIYKKGSFDEVKIEGKIDFLITLQFLHEFTNDKVKTIYSDILDRLDIQNIIVDVVPLNPHAWSTIFPENYHHVKTMGPYRYGGVVEVWTKIPDSSNFQQVSKNNSTGIADES